jgi:hypothetical protein
MLHGIGWKVKLEITIEITENTPLKIPFKSATQEGGIKMFGLLVAFYPGVKNYFMHSRMTASFIYMFRNLVHRIPSPYLGT